MSTIIEMLEEAAGKSPMPPLRVDDYRRVQVKNTGPAIAGQGGTANSGVVVTGDASEDTP